jgi:hypothetical protein
MAVNLSPVAGAGWQFFDNNGVPLSGGLIYTYLAGTTTPQATYTTSSGNVANANPIVLDSSGRPPYQVWLSLGYSYKFILQTSTATQIWSQDNISSIPIVSAIESTATATQGQTVFSGLTYATGTNSLKVFVNGSKQIVTLNYTETTSSSITFVSGLNAGDVVEFLQ